MGSRDGCAFRFVATVLEHGCSKTSSTVVALLFFRERSHTKQKLPPQPSFRMGDCEKRSSSSSQSTNHDPCPPSDQGGLRRSKRAPVPVHRFNPIPTVAAATPSRQQHPIATNRAATPRSRCLVTIQQMSRPSLCQSTRASRDSQLPTRGGSDNAASPRPTKKHATLTRAHKSRWKQHCSTLRIANNAWCRPAIAPTRAMMRRNRIPLRRPALQRRRTARVETLEW